MKIDLLVAEIGSTTTVLNAFNRMGTPDPVFVGQGAAPTTVHTDVLTGLQNAIEDLSKKLGEDIVYEKMLATSSAAGGLRMTVHGLVYDMTVKAGQEAALGAGANIHMATAGPLQDFDLQQIDAINPNLILLAGGTDYGERETALNNAKLLRDIKSKAPIIYCGNVQNKEIIKSLFEEANRKFYITENVYPKLDQLNVEPVRKIVHRAFEAEITEAKGMSHIREMVTGKIMPTPGAVMECAKILYNEIGDVVVIDVGGATTDIHSVTEGSEDIALIQVSPEPLAKRTVEGDLGVYVSAESLCQVVGIDTLEKELGFDMNLALASYAPIPKTEEQIAIATTFAWYAASIAIKRHVGSLHHTYGSTGRQTWAQGKDLTTVRWLVATGGALTKLPKSKELLERLANINQSGTMLYPPPNTLQMLQDARYIMASVGVMYSTYPQEAIALLKKSLV
ncbi:MAG: GlmL-related ornithine degradation protein [Defluviitaleaceae bacterium]|nr:GlmL-related ornithine degradation protein [Defluviitaleaceae bacterium]